jgi:Protein of unknown function (DUF3106)
MAQAARGVIVALLLVCAAAAFAAEPKGPSWQQLTSQQQGILEPLQESWDNLSGARKRKWIEVAKRYPRLNPQEQGRLRVRMKDWATLSPEQRREARDAYRKFDTLPPDQKQVVREKWEQYQQLQQEKRRELAAQRATSEGGAGAGSPAPEGSAETAKPVDSVKPPAEGPARN